MEQLRALEERKAAYDQSMEIEKAYYEQELEVQESEIQEMKTELEEV